MVIYDIKSFSGTRGRCGLDIVNLKIAYTVILTQIPDSAGMSITDEYDAIATHIYHRMFKGKVAPWKIVWIEHHFFDNAFELNETFDKVSMQWCDDLNKYEKPHRVRVHPA